MKVWVGILVLALFVAIFAVQNAHPVPVHFLFWVAPKVSLSLLIILAALVGAVVGAVGGMIDGRRRSQREAHIVMAPESVALEENPPEEAQAPE